MLPRWLRRRPPAPEPPPVRAPGSDAEARLRRLEWTVIKRLDGLLQGDHRTLLRGHGLDLADLREHQPHDDVRHIDWNVTARLQRPHVRVFTEERDLSAWFLLDLSPSVDFGSGRSKREALTELVTVLARLLTQRGDRVGAVLHPGGGGPQTVLPARGGRTQVLRLLHLLQPPAAPPPGGGTRLDQLLRTAHGALRGRCAVFVVSDFISEPGWTAPLAALARRHDVVAVRLFDPLEQTLPDLGLLPMRDAETGEQLMVDTHDPGFRRRYAQAAAAREQSLRDALAAAGVDTLDLGTGDDPAAAVLRLTDLRRLRLRQPGVAAARGRRPAPTQATPAGGPPP